MSIDSLAGSAGVPPPKPEGHKKAGGMQFHFKVSAKLRESPFGKFFGTKLQKELGILMNNMIHTMKQNEQKARKEAKKIKRMLKGEG